MSRLPQLRARKVIAALQRAGFVQARVRGSHHFLQHPDGRCTVIPAHAGEDIGRGLLRKILDDCELTADEFLDLL